MLFWEEFWDILSDFPEEKRRLLESAQMRKKVLEEKRREVGDA